MAQTHDDLEGSAEVNELEWSVDRNPDVSHLKLHASSSYTWVHPLPRILCHNVEGIMLK